MATFLQIFDVGCKRIRYSDYFTIYIHGQELFYKFVSNFTYKLVKQLLLVHDCRTIVKKSVLHIVILHPVQFHNIKETGQKIKLRQIYLPYLYCNNSFISFSHYNRGFDHQKMSNQLITILLLSGLGRKSSLKHR